MIGTFVIAAVALLQWLYFWRRLVFRRSDSSEETPFLLSTIAVALVWTYLAASPTGREKRPESGSPIVRKSGCASIRQDMPVSELRSSLGAPERKVPEADTRGPGAEAWVYAEAGCVAHVLNDQVHSVDYE